ncbi:MAG: AtpZ/AtpI family protein [Candidatus Jordarchaeales archaeon]
MPRSDRFTKVSVGRWIMVGSEIPVMVVAGAYIGYYIGKQIPWVEPFSTFLGAFLGFMLGVYNTYKLIQVLERKERLSVTPVAGRTRMRSEVDKRKAGSRSSEILELLRLQQKDAETEPQRAAKRPSGSHE